MKKRVLALLLVMLMVVGMIPTSVFAADTEEVLYGFYQNGSWSEDSTTDGHKEYEGIELWKTAKEVGENQYEVELGVKTTKAMEVAAAPAATVLVIDVSNSMDYCAECGGNGSHHRSCKYHSWWWFLNYVQSSQTRLTAAKKAAKAFLDAYVDGVPAGTERKLAIVKFGTSSSQVLGWTDVVNSGYQTAVNAINDLFVGGQIGGATNLEAGLEEAVKLHGSVSIDKKATIVLSDGKPTYDNCAPKHGDGSYCSKTIIDDTQITADGLKELSTVYTVCYGAKNETCYKDLTVGTYLCDYISSKTECAYNADNTEELNKAFRAINKVITSGTDGKGAVVTDPMGAVVGEYEASKVTALDDKLGFTWTLTDANEENGTYTYTMTYTVTLGDDANVASVDGYFPLNEKTYLTIGNVDYEFPVPAVKPTYTVTYNQGEHGVLIEGENEVKDVVTQNLSRNANTPEEPEVRAEKGYEFVGWAPEVAEKVTKSVTYTAQYVKIITLVGKSDEVTYNGSKQSLTDYEVEGLPEGYEIDGVTYEAAGEEVDNYPGAFDLENIKITKDKQDVTNGFKVETAPGTLTINPLEVTVTIKGNSDTVTYDGNPHTVEGYVATSDNELYDVDQIETSVDAVATGTAVGTYEVGLKPEDFKNSNGNFDVTFVVEDGKLVVTPISTKIVITADSASKTYDGTVLTDSGYTYTDGILAEGDELTAVVEGAIVDAGSVENKVVDYKVMRGQQDVTDSYTIVTANGTLTVKPREITLTSGNATKVYDGTALTSKEITVGGDGFVTGEGANVTLTGSQLNAGVSENAFTYALTEETKAENYVIKSVFGKLEVTPKAVTITSGSASKNYDGKALTCNKVTANGFIEGEGATYTVTGSQTEVGSSKNTFNYKLNENTLAENYEITKVEGKLEVEPPIEIPDTGDNANLALYVGLMAVSAAAFLFLLLNGKKKGKYSA